MTRRDLRLLGLLATAPALLFLAPFLFGKTHFAGDVLYSFQPWLSHAAQELQRGKLPLWNPFSSCGEPFLANPQIMTFFPPASLFWFFDFTTGWRAHLLLEQTLLLVSVYFLARGRGRGGAALAALALAWGGFTITLWEFPGALATLPFAVMFLLFAARGAAAGMAAATTMLFFAGYTQFAYYALLAGGAMALRRPRALPAAALAVAAGILAASVQILPTWEVVRQSVRAGVDEGLARQYLLTPVFLVKLLLPDLHDKIALPYLPTVFGKDLWPIARNWLNTFYVGIPALALAAVGMVSPRRRFVAAWAGIGAAALLLAMGVEPFFGVFRSLVPGARYMTHFSNAMLLAVLALGMLSAEGFRARAEKPKALWAVLGALALAAGAHALIPPLRQATATQLLGVEALNAAQHAMIGTSAWKALALLGVAGAALELLKRPGAALAVIALTDLWLFGRDLQPLLPAGLFHERPSIVARLQGTDARLAVNPRSMRENDKPMEGDTLEEGTRSLRQALHPNIHLPYRIPHAWGYEVFANARFTQVRQAVPLDQPAGPVLDFLGARDILSSRPMNPPLTLAARRTNALLYRNASALPRVTRATRVKTFGDGKAMLDYMAGPWDPRVEALLERAGGPDAGTSSTLRWEEEPGKVRAEGTSGGGRLVYSQIHFPGWEAYVNGRRVPTERTNHAFQSVQLPEEDWRAVLLYRPGLFQAGLATALAVLLLATAGGAVFLKRL